MIVPYARHYKPRLVYFLPQVQMGLRKVFCSIVCGEGNCRSSRHQVTKAKTAAQQKPMEGDGFRVLDKYSKKSPFKKFERLQFNSVWLLTLKIDNFKKHFYTLVTLFSDTGTPLIGRFLGPRKNRLNRNPSYQRSFYGINS